MRKLSWLRGAVLSVVLALGVSLPGCQIGKAHTRNSDSNAAERPNEPAPCRFG